MVKNMQGTYMLDVSKNVLHTYLWYALKFSILEQPQYKQWYHSYFLNPVIYAYRGRNDYKIDYCEYFDEMKVFAEVLDIEEYTDRNCVKSYVGDFFRCCLIEGKYIEIELDFFYIEEYGERHYTHPLLIYGYEDKTYYALGFNRNNVFAFFTLSERELVEAYYSAVEINYTKENMVDKYAYHLL